MNSDLACMSSSRTCKVLFLQCQVAVVNVVATFHAFMKRQGGYFCSIPLKQVFMRLTCFAIYEPLKQVDAKFATQ